MFLSPCISPVTEMATSPALHAEEKRTKNCYHPFHASLPVQVIALPDVKLLPVVPVVRVVDPTPLVLPAGFPEEVSPLQPAAVYDIRVYLVALLGQEKRKGPNMSGIWIFLLIIGGWVLLQGYILPKFGIST